MLTLDLCCPDILFIFCVCPQQDEVEYQRIGEIIDTVKLEGFAKSVRAEEGTQSNKEDLETKLKAMKEKQKRLYEEIEELKDENANSDHMIDGLTSMHRSANDELEEARKIAVVAMAKYGNRNLKLKRMGDIDQEPWKAACQRLYRDHTDGWEMVFSKKLSEWEDLLKDPGFTVFKIVQIGGLDKWELQVDSNNKQLKDLRSELGDEVCQTVVVAMKEMEDHNASGRYPVRVIWNFKHARMATLKEIVKRLFNTIKALDLEKEAETRTARNRVTRNAPNRIVKRLFNIRQALALKKHAPNR